MLEQGSAGDADPSRELYWIGGSPGAGKSSVTRALARRHGLWTYYMDWHLVGHQEQRAARDGEFPALAAWNEKGIEEHWVTDTPEQMAMDVIAVWVERFPLVARDAASLPPGAGLIEGAGCFPESVLTVAHDPAHTIWLVPTPDFLRRVRRERHARGLSVAFQTSDPARALENIIERDILLAGYVRDETAKHGVRLLTVDGDRAIDLIADEVERAFGLTALSDYIGTYEGTGGKRYSVRREEVQLLLDPGNRPPLALEPRGDRTFRVNDELFMGEPIRFELDAARNVTSFLAASDRFVKLS